jgi:hypothetical protein
MTMRDDNSRAKLALIAGALVLGLLLVAVGYLFTPNYIKTATNIQSTSGQSSAPASPGAPVPSRRAEP